MGYIDWEAKGRVFGNCNCAYGCPCQFNAPPTHGDCRAIVGLIFDEGHFADIRLDGLRAVHLLRWPGAVHEGGGETQLIIDSRADPAQREALRRIMYGEETVPGTTSWSVYMSTVATVYEPLYRSIEFDVDIEARRAKLVVDGLIEAIGEPIRNPVTGEEHRVRIDIPEGIGFSLAEMGSGTSRSASAIAMELNDSYGQFSRFHDSTNGTVR